MTKTTEEVYTILPIKGGGEFNVTVGYVEKLKADYGEYVNIDIEIKKMRTWLESNPGRQKTKRGMPRFMTSWILRAVGDVQNRDRARAEKSGFGNRDSGFGKSPRGRTSSVSAGGHAEPPSPQWGRQDSFDVNEFFELALIKSYREMGYSKEEAMRIAKEYA